MSHLGRLKFRDIDWPAHSSGGRKAFVRSVIDAYAEQFGGEDDEEEDDEEAEGTSAAVCLGRPLAARLHWQGVAVNHDVDVSGKAGTAGALVLSC